MVTIATWAFGGSYDAETNLTNHLGGIAEAAAAGADLVVFPEASLQGYPAMTSAGNLRDVLRTAYATAEPLDGPRVMQLREAARNFGIHVIFGMTERGLRSGVVFNSSVLIGPGGILGAYRKVHVGIQEQVIWSPGSEWPVFDTPFGRVGMLICYDQVFPESCRELMLRGAELVVMPTAWSLRPDETSPESALSVEQYVLYGRARAAENCLWFISSNFAGRLGTATFCGHSQVIDPLGRVIADTGSKPEPRLVLANIDVQSGIEDAYAWGTGAKLWRDRRPGMYTSISAPVTIA
jgi:predicted amidohydrolase